MVGWIVSSFFPWISRPLASRSLASLFMNNEFVISICLLYR
jgi:hypothetical protein